MPITVKSNHRGSLQFVVRLFVFSHFQCTHIALQVSPIISLSEWQSFHLNQEAVVAELSSIHLQQEPALHLGQDPRDFPVMAPTALPLLSLDLQITHLG